MQFRAGDVLLVFVGSLCQLMACWLLLQPLRKQDCRQLLGLKRKSIFSNYITRWSHFLVVSHRDYEVTPGNSQAHGQNNTCFVPWSTYTPATRAWSGYCQFVEYLIGQPKHVGQLHQPSASSPSRWPLVCQIVHFYDCLCTLELFQCRRKRRWSISLSLIMVQWQHPST